MAKFTGHTITSDSALGAAKILRSLRFDGNDSNTQHLVRTPSSTGNQKIWTFSAWIKRGTGTGSGPDYIYAAHDGSDYFALYFRYNELYSYFSPVYNEFNYPSQIPAQKNNPVRKCNPIVPAFAGCNNLLS